jgi:hypothetical protein
MPADTGRCAPASVGTVCPRYPSVPTFLAVSTPFDARREFLGAARRYLLESPRSPEPAPVVPPRLTFAALEKIPMSRSRERILANLEEMYSEAFKRAKAAEDEAQMASLDFAYRREQLYFEILLDVRDAVERRG